MTLSERLPKRIHIGCGRCYLPPEDGWINCDMDRPTVFIASDRKDLVERWKTADENDGYYGRVTVTKDRVAAGPAPSDETVCDVKMDALRGWPFGCGTVDEVLLRQVMEHWSVAEVRRFFEHADYAVKPGGIVRLDLPDMDAAVEKLLTTSDARERALMVRHILGHRDGDGDRHYCAYSRDRVKDFAAEWDFEFVEEEPPLRERWYPAFCLRFRKPLISARDPLPWQRILPPETIPADWKVLEVGPGSRGGFFPRANVELDGVDRGEADLPPGARFVHADVCSDLPFSDKEFDLVVMFHVAEHVSDPRRMAANLTRIAKRGVIECPHPFKEALFGFHLDHPEHRWWVFPPARDGAPLRFMRVDESRVSKLRSRDVQAAMHRMLRMGPLGTSDATILRHWLLGNHEAWNTVYRWDGELKVEVLD